ncbi:MAG: hypothetical protein PHE79_01740 [Eubacteriales bacterium]|nr:hypothetical protein [Eubacteriales bacterium]
MKNGKIFLMLLLICTLLASTACATNDDNVVPDVPNVTDDGIINENGEGIDNGGGHTNNGGANGGMDDPGVTTNGGIAD